MEILKGKYLRPGRKITDQFILAAAITVLIISVSQTFFPTEWAVGPFEALLGGDHDAAMFLNSISSLSAYGSTLFWWFAFSR